MSKFKNYYDSDPDFRRRHLDNMMEKIVCDCGFETAKANLSRHRKSRNHEKRMANHLNLQQLEEMKTKIDDAIKILKNKF